MFPENERIQPKKNLPLFGSEVIDLQISKHMILKHRPSNGLNYC